MNFQRKLFLHFILALALLLLPLSVATAKQKMGLTFPSPDENARIERLVGLAKVWGTVKFFHPSLGYREIDWDKALIETIPRVNVAKTPQEYQAAINHLLSYLNDKNTFAEIKTERTQSKNTIKKEPLRIEDGVLIIEALRFDEIEVSKINQAFSEAKMIVIDLRATEYPKSNDLDDFREFMEGIFSQILETNAPTATLRYRIHNGYAPHSGYSSEDIYYSAVVNTTPQLIIGRGKKTTPPTALVMNEKTPPLAEVFGGLQSLNQVRIVQEGGREPSIKTYPMNLPDGVVVRMRIVELVNADGSTGLNSDSIVPDNTNEDAVLKEAIRTVKEYKPTQATNKQPIALKPLTLKDNPYPEMKFPNTEYRLLALFRYWNVINYFFPYKDLIDEPWDNILPRYIPKFEANKDAADYQEIVRLMQAEIQDSHGVVSATPQFFQRRGGFLPPVRVRYIQEQSVVTHVFDENAGIKIGDSILKINGEPIETYREKEAEIFAASTRQALQRDMHPAFLRGQKDSKIKLTLRGIDGKIRDVEVSRTLPLGSPLLRDSQPTLRKTPVYAVLPSGFGYVDMNRFRDLDFEPMFETIKNTPAVIFDMRGYPRASNHAIAARLTERKNVITARLAQNYLDARDLTKDWMKRSKINFELTLDKPEGAIYKGKVAVLINEYAQSAAEQFCLNIEAVTDVTFIGTPTAGANGDVTNTVVPGDLVLKFTGLDVRHADGRQLQRLGIQPHIKAEPTIRGIVEGRDEILEAAIRYLQEKEKKIIVSE